MIIAGITVSASASAPEVFRSNDVSRMSELTAKGDGFMHRGEADSAFAYYSRIIECYNPTLDDAKKRLCARAFNNAGYLSFFHKGNFPQAYSWFLMAEQLAEELHLDSTLGYVWLNIGNIYGMFEIESDAVKMYRKAFFQSKKCGDWKNMLMAFSNLASGHIEKGEFDGMEDVLQAFGELTLPDSVARSAEYARCDYEAVMSIRRGDYDGAVKAMERASHSVGTLPGGARLQLGARLQMAIIRQRQGRMADADLLFRSVLAEACRTGQPDVEARCWKGLADIFEAGGKGDSARVCLVKMYAIRDSMLSLASFSTVRDVAGMHAKKISDEKVRILAEKKEVRERLLLVVGGAAAIVTLLLLWIVRANRKLRERNRQLYDRYRRETEREKQRESSPQPQNMAASDEAAQALYGRIMEVMMSDAVFDQSFSADTLARLTDSKTRYISQVLSDVAGKNFSTLLAERRVAEASLRLADREKFGHLTIEAIGESVGFKSRTWFATTFKKVTGLTPREFQKAAMQSGS